MLVSLHFNQRTFHFNAARPISIAIPLNFDGVQPNAYGVDAATAEPCAAGVLVGDTRRGGSCNFEEYRLVPHCVGTHTECVGHLTHERIPVHERLRDPLIPARLVTVAPTNFEDCGESYASTSQPGDPVISRHSLESAISDSTLCPALVVRTLPNDNQKLSARYLDGIPPYFTTEAILLLLELGVRHLLVDTPSIDRLFDGGRLSNHRGFWKVDRDSFDVNDETRLYATVTELIFVPPTIADGEYILNLQIPPFMTDAAPSRPILFKVENA